MTDDKPFWKMAIQSPTVSQPTVNAPSRVVRLYYLDWLRVIATLGVFLFHATNVFNTTGFVIKNAECTDLITNNQAFFFP